MRLLFVSHSLPPEDRPLDNLGGMQRVALELDAALRDHTGVTYNTRFLRAPWKTIHIQSAGFLVGSIPALARLARRREVDVILFSSMVTAALAVFLRPVFQRNGIMTAAIVHGLDVTTPSRLYQWFVPKVFAALDLVMPVSAATGEECVKRGLDRDRLRPVRNGVDTARFVEPGFGRTERRNALAAIDGADRLPEGAVVLASVGRQVERKGFTWFVREVMPGLPDHIHYWLAGDGPEHAAIRGTIEAAGLAHRVRLLGRVSEEELGALYQGADLFVMPNIPVPGDMEGFGVVMLEAGLSGLPSVGARLEGIAEVITNDHNGRLVESGDADAFSTAIRHYVDDPAFLTEASRSAYQHTRSHFSWASVGAEYVEVLKARLATRDRTAAPAGK
ncbi:MAG: phosphatidylinositol alpha-1,6-mannosyltransferase [Rhodothermales bacterium]|jgi:phosphatidylinositol alpha-1,6-mannosyltransferase